MSVLAIDAGTTGVTALVVGEAGEVVGRGHREFRQLFPRPGWVEHEPEDIWTATLAACRQALDAAPGGPTAVGVTNQRETAVLWDRETLRAPRPAVVWQDRRTAAICDRLREAGHEPRVAELTGLRLDPYFTGTKLAWLAEHDQRAWAGVADGRTAVGTVDAYVVARLTAGARHVTDPAEFLGLRLPVAGVAGDQQAALFGQACYAPGQSKCTYGTGSFVLVNTGDTVVRSAAGLLSTVAWELGGGLVHALEGAVFVTGAAVQWLRDGLGLIGSAPEVEALAASVPDAGGVVFVPALTGLGAPDWDPRARGTILGITRGTTRAHLARATLEAIAFEVRDVVDVMVCEAGIAVPELSADGGAAANDLLCQLQADQIGVPVRRPEVTETTGLCAAFLAGLGTGMWSSTAELAGTWRMGRRFEPAAGARDDGRHARWRRAVDRARGWEPAG